MCGFLYIWRVFWSASDTKLLWSIGKTDCLHYSARVDLYFHQILLIIVHMIASHIFHMSLAGGANMTPGRHISNTVLSLLEAPDATTLSKALLFRAILRITGALIVCYTWWRHQMETFSRYWPFVRGIHRSPVNYPPTQRPVTRSFDVFFDLRLNKRFSKQSSGWWFETLTCPL